MVTLKASNKDTIVLYILANTDKCVGAYAGLLPKAYNEDGGGTRASPPELNDRNQKHADLSLPDTSTCAYVVDYVAPGAPDISDAFPPSEWSLVREELFLDQSSSLFPSRAFWWPGSHQSNVWGRYQLWRHESLLGPCIPTSHQSV